MNRYSVSDSPYLPAWQQATHALSIAADTRLDATQATALLRRCLAQWTQDDSTPSAESRTRNVLPRLTCELVQLAPFLQPGVPQQLSEALSDPVYAQRLAQLAADLLLSEPVAPEICLALSPAPLAWSRLHESFCDAVIFADDRLITHELYPLFVDACVANGLDQTLVGVHVDWLVGDCATRVVTYDLQRDLFVETPLATPLALDRVLLLSLGPQEQQLHRQLDQVFGDRCRNPWAVAQQLDNKRDTVSAWRRLGLTVPEQRSCPVNASTTDLILKDSGEWVLKPVASSLGQGVALVPKQASPEHVSALLRSCWRHGDGVIESRRDGISWRDDDGTQHTLAIRLHVVSDAKGIDVESGYATVGIDTHTPASKLHGGHTIGLPQALAGLARRGGEDLHVDGAALLADLTQTAIAAANVFAGIDLVGVDLVLDLVDQSTVAVLIEANPRPAGLIHSRRLSDQMPGVSTKLWSSRSAVQESVA